MSTEVKQRGKRNILAGKVISDKMDKSISVLIYNSVKHPKYKKYIKKTSVFKVHDEKNQAKVGDIVRIFETRALSKTKRWKLIDLVQSGKEEYTDLNLDYEVKKNPKEKINSDEAKQEDSEEEKET